MKKLITILFLFAFSVNAQIQQDKLNHLSVGYIVGFAGNGGTYLLLSEGTNWNINSCKAISSIAGFGLSILAGHLKESNDNFYNKKDFNYTALGGLIGTLSVSFIIGKSKPLNRIPINDVFEIKNDPLISEKNLNR